MHVADVAYVGSIVVAGVGCKHYGAPKLWISYLFPATLLLYGPDGALLGMHGVLSHPQFASSPPANPYHREGTKKYGISQKKKGKLLAKAREQAAAEAAKK